MYGECDMVICLTSDFSVCNYLSWSDAIQVASVQQMFIGIIIPATVFYVK